MSLGVRSKPPVLVQPTRRMVAPDNRPTPYPRLLQTGRSAMQAAKNRQYLFPPRPHHTALRPLSIRASKADAAAAVQYLAGPIEHGKRVTSNGDLVVVGDVQKGAKLTAAGDVIVWGRLAGHVHAGAQGKGAKIMALELKGAQLKIGDVGTLVRAKVTVPGPHVASVQVAGSHRSLQLTAMNNTPQPDAAVLANSKIRWLRYYPACSTALWTGLYATIAGIALMWKPKPVFGLLFDASSLPVGWIRVGGILLATFGLQYLGAAVFDHHMAATSRAKPSGATTANSSSGGGSSSSSGSSDRGSRPTPAAMEAASVNSMSPPAPVIEAYASLSVDDGEGPPLIKMNGAAGGAAPGPFSTGQDTSSSNSSSSMAESTSAASSSSAEVSAEAAGAVTKNVSAKTLSRGLDATVRRQHNARSGSSSGSGAGSSSSSSSSSRSLWNKNSSSGSGTTSDAAAGSSSSSGGGGSQAFGGRTPASATWAFSSSGFYTATIWSRLFLVAGFVWLVFTGQVQPGLLLLAGLNLLGAIKMWFALQQQYMYHIMGETPVQSAVGWMLEGALR